MAKPKYQIVRYGTQVFVRLNGNLVPLEALPIQIHRAVNQQIAATGMKGVPDVSKTAKPARAPDGGTVGGPPPVNNPLVTRTTMPTGGFFDNAKPVVPKAGTHSAAETRATQTFLKNKGYNVQVDGVWGPQTQSAALNWRNDRNPTTWNRSINATPSTRPTFQPTPVSKNATPAGDGGYIEHPPSAPPAPTNTAAPTPTSDTSFIDSLMKSLGAPNTGKALPLGIASIGTQGIDMSGIPGFTPLDPQQYLGMAGASDQAQLQVLMNQLGINSADAAQHQADIGNWFGQVQSSLGDAISGGGAATKAAQGYIGNAGSSIGASLGGSALPGGNQIAAEAKSGGKYVGAVGKANSNYLGSMQGILQIAQNDAAEREAARMSQERLQLENSLIMAQGQAKQDEFNNMMAMLGYNQQGSQQAWSNQMAALQYNQQLQAQKLQNILGISKYNADLGQQGFTNRLAAAGLQLQGGQFGLQAADAASTIAARNAGVVNDNARTALGISQAVTDRNYKAQQAAIAGNQAVQNAIQSGFVSGVNRRLWNQKGVVPQGGVQAAVSAIKTSAMNLPVAVRKQVIRTQLLGLRNAAGRQLIPLSMIQQWGY